MDVMRSLKRGPGRWAMKVSQQPLEVQCSSIRDTYTKVGLSMKSRAVNTEGRSVGPGGLNTMQEAVAWLIDPPFKYPSSRGG